MGSLIIVAYNFSMFQNHGAGKILSAVRFVHLSTVHLSDVQISSPWFWEIKNSEAELNAWMQRLHF